MRTISRQTIDRLFPVARSRVLSLLLLDPDERRYVREVVRRTRCALGPVHRELKALAEAGILVAARDGNRTYYQANKSCPFFAELSGLMRKTAGLADVLRRALLPLSNDIATAFIYGSQATGTASTRSDVDLLVVGDVNAIALHRAVSEAEAELARTVNYTLLSCKEFDRRRREKGGFLSRVLAGDRIALMGEPHEAR